MHIVLATNVQVSGVPRSSVIHGRVVHKVATVELKQNTSAISVHISADANTLLTSNYIPLSVEGE